MEFLDKKLPKISPGTNNILNKTKIQNNNTSINMNKNMNLNKANAPVNPFVGFNHQNASS